MNEWYITKQTRKEIQPLEQRILSGLIPKESLIYDLQKTPWDYFALTWIGRSKVNVDPSEYQFVGKVVHSSIHLKEVYELYRKVGL